MDGGSEVTSLADAAPGNGTSSAVKRVFDVLFASTVLVGVFPWLFPIIAAAIKLTSRGPVLFKQERWGENGRKIVCYKFRSMVATSRDVDENGRFQQATRDDPRVTVIGRFLRRTNLDELPQFLNVLKGEMSVVGPRPHPIPLDREFSSVIPNYVLRHSVRPGITGLAQVNGYRGETPAAELMRKRIEHDLWYIENWSFWLDLRIVALTAWQVLRFRG
jgi:putative colanic acid biosynthesis UDP-glucose lipid carrier transferase